MENNEMIKKAVEDYGTMYKIPKDVQKKLIKLWTMRACRFFVKGQVDSLMVEEDVDEENLEYGLNYESKQEYF